MHAEEQKELLERYSHSLWQANELAWEGYKRFETSEIKGRVFGLWARIERDNELEPVLKKQLLAYLEEARDALFHDSTESARKCSSILAKAANYLDDELQRKACA